MKSSVTIRSGLLTAAILIAAGCSSGNGASVNTPVALAQQPTISTIGDQTVPQDGVSNPISFSISDPDSDIATLRVTAASNNKNVISNDGLTVGGNGASRTLTISPNERAFGTAQVLVTVIDPTGSSMTSTFAVNVTTMQVSFKAFATQTVAKDENTLPQTITGLSFNQDADDPTSFDSTLMN